MQVLINGGGSFSVSQTLALPGTDNDPLSLAVGDFDDSDADDGLDLAVSAFGGDRVHVYRNLGAGTFATTPGSFDAPYAARVRDRGRPQPRRPAGPAGGGERAVRLPGPGGHGLRSAGDRGGATGAVGRRRGRLQPGRLAGRGRGQRDLERRVAPAQHGLPRAPARGLARSGRLRDRAAALRARRRGQGPRRGRQPGDVHGGHGGPVDRAGDGRPAGPAGGARSRRAAADGRHRVVQRPELPHLRPAGPALPAAVLARRAAARPDPHVHPGPECCRSSGLRRSARRPPRPSARKAATTSTRGRSTRPTSPFAYTPDRDLANPPVASVGTRSAVAARVDGCSASVSRAIYAGDLLSTTLAIQGCSTVCVDCIGGTITPTDVGGGVPQSRQWGYRAVSGGRRHATMPGETGETYVLKGSSFPGPGTYYVVVDDRAHLRLPHGVLRGRRHRHHRRSPPARSSTSPPRRAARPRSAARSGSSGSTRPAPPTRSASAGTRPRTPHQRSACRLPTR